jgi:hypothetical protein
MDSSLLDTDDSLLDLRRLANGGTEAIPLVYTLQAETGRTCSCLGSYTPSDGGAIRLVTIFSLGTDVCPGVWETGTGAFLGPLQGVQRGGQESWSLLTYQRSSDRRPRIAAG